MPRLRCLMIGAGGMAGAYVRGFFPQFAERVEIVGLAEIRRETLDSAGDFLGLPASARFTDLGEAFARVEADFCTIVIPPPSIAPQSWRRSSAACRSSARSRSRIPGRPVWRSTARSPGRGCACRWSRTTATPRAS
jgi:hypothetical protein